MAPRVKTTSKIDNAFRSEPTPSMGQWLPAVTKAQVAEEISPQASTVFSQLIDSPIAAINTQDSLSQANHRSCVNEVISLDPNGDDKPLTDLTAQWLTKPRARWPPSADIRVKTFMHEHNYYDIDDTDSKTLALINELRQGTELQHCEGTQYHLLEQRLRDRVSFFAKDLWAKFIIEHDSNRKPQKTACFKSYWERRHSYWMPTLKDEKTPSGLTVRKVRDMNTQSAGGTTFAGSRNSASKRPPVISVFKEMETPLLVTQSDPEESPSLGYISPYPSKRNKTSPGVTEGCSVTKASKQPIDLTKDLHPMDPPQDPGANDSETAGHIQFAQELLPNSFAPLDFSFSPQTSSAQKSNLNSSLPIPNILPAALHTLKNDERLPLTTLTEISSNDDSTSSYRQRLILIIQKAGLGLDLEKSLSSTEFRHLNVSEFFHLYSQRSGKPLESLSCLTFTFIFAPGNDTLVRRGDEGRWKRLKDLAMILFTLFRQRNPTETEFHMVVEIGDVHSKKGVLNNLWDP